MRNMMTKHSRKVLAIFLLTLLASFAASEEDVAAAVKNVSSNSPEARAPAPAPPPQPEENSKNMTLVDKGAVEQEHNSSMSIFFVLMVIMMGILMIHIMLQLPNKFQYLPESIVVVFLGALIGLALKNVDSSSWEREEVFSPTGFFLVLLPPIIFESGYNLHKGNFFQVN